MKPRPTTLLLAAAVAVGFAGTASAVTVIYQQTFGTDTTDLLTDYGFSESKSGAAVGNARVENGIAVWTGSSSGPAGSNYYLWRDISAFTYDWSQPLTLTVDIGSQSTGSGQSYGLALYNSTPSSGNGLSYSFYWPSASNGSFFGNAQGGGTRITNNTDPDMVATTRPLVGSPTMATVAFTVRQNAGDSTLFDYMVTVNGFAQTNAGTLPSGVTQVGDWYVGVSKANYGISGADPFNAVGIRSDGMGWDGYLDNISLTMIPEPASFVLLGMAGFAGLIRRRRP
jgi:hypothetical protein